MQSIQPLEYTSLLNEFLKYGQLDFSKASGSISDHLTSIFPENVWMSRFFRIFSMWVTRSEHPKSAKDKVKGLQLEVGARRAPRLLVLHIVHVG